MIEIKIVSNVTGNAEYIFNKINRLEQGFRAVAVAYDEHISDKNSFENINRLRDNISYRLFAAREQYMIYTGGILRAEKELLNMVKHNRKEKISPMSQTFTEWNNELNLSSYFDNILFNLGSAFDYLGHIISYCLYKHQDRTFDWDKLVKKTKNEEKFKNLKVVQIIDEVNRSIVQALYDYRSRLIHRTRDKHNLKFEVDSKLSSCRLYIITSNVAKKKLKHFLKDKKDSKKYDEYSLNYTISSVIHKCLESMELVLDSLYEMILDNSNWPQSAFSEKRKIFLIQTNPETGTGEPTSKKLWEDFKSNGWN